MFNYFFKRTIVSVAMIFITVFSFGAITINLNTEPTTPSNFGEGFTFDKITIAEENNNDFEGSYYTITMVAPAGFYFSNMGDPTINTGDIEDAPERPGLTENKTTLVFDFSVDGTDFHDEIYLNNIEISPLTSSTVHNGTLSVTIKKTGVTNNTASQSFGPYRMVNPEIYIPDLHDACEDQPYTFQLSILDIDDENDTTVLAGSSDITLKVDLISTDDGEADKTVINDKTLDPIPTSITIEGIAKDYEQIKLTVTFESGWTLERIIQYRYEDETQDADIVFWEIPDIEFKNDNPNIFVSLIEGDIALSEYLVSNSNCTFSIEEDKEQLLIIGETDSYFRAGIAPLGSHEIYVTKTNIGCSHQETLTITVLPDMITVKEIYCQDIDILDTVKVAVAGLDNVLVGNSDYIDVTFDRLEIKGNGGILRTYYLAQDISESNDFYEFEIRPTELFYEANVGRDTIDVTIQIQVIANVSFLGIVGGQTRKMNIGRKISEIKIPLNDGFLEDFSDIYCWAEEPVELTSNRTINNISTANNSYIYTDDKNRFWLDLHSFDSTTNTTIPITLSYFDQNTCPGISEYISTIHAVPVVEFENNIICEGTDQNFEQVSPDSNWVNIVGWQWDFGDDYDISNFADTNQKVLPNNHSTTSGTYKNPIHKYADPGKKVVTLSVMSAQGCTNSKSDTIVIGKYPSPVFTFEGKLMDNPVTLLNKSDIFPDDSVNNYQYTIIAPSGNTTNYSLQDRRSQEFVPNEPGVHKVTLWASSMNNCRQFADTLIPVFPVKAVTSDNFYFEDFTENTNEKGWLPSYAYLETQAETWKHTPVEGVFNDGDKHTTGNMWLTGDPEDQINNEHSWMESPCFDFSELTFPMISVDVFNSIEPGRDGAVAQYTLNDGKTWKTLGATGNGANWYNMDGIYSNPGANNGGTNVGSHGWSKDTTVWETARYALDNVKKQSIDSGSCVRFRFAYNSNDYHDSTYKGFGIDNFLIGKRKRIVLLEQLINRTWEETRNFAENERYDPTALNSFVDSHKVEIVDIRYHIATNTFKDPLFETFNNWQDNSVRASELAADPAGPLWAMDGTAVRSRVHGILQKNLNYDLAFEKRALIDPVFEIEDVQTELDGKAMNISATIRKVNAHIDEKIGLHQHWVRFAIVQKKYKDEDGTEHRNVFIEMLPNGLGSVVKFIEIPFPVGSEVTVTSNWEPSIKTAGNDFRLVIFISGDMMHGEIEQVWYTDLDNADIPQYSTGVGNICLSGNETILYPNPATERLYVKIPEDFSNSVNWNIYDLSGQMVSSGQLYNPDKEESININNLYEGIYIIQFINQDGHAISGKFSKTE